MARVNLATINRWIVTSTAAAVLCCLTFLPGCATGRRSQGTQNSQSDVATVAGKNHDRENRRTHLLTSYRAHKEDDGPEEVVPAAEVGPTESLSHLEALAESQNPRLRRLGQEVAAAEARTGYAAKLPDPTVGANIFASPIETAAGAQRANVTVMQMFPWLSRLSAQEQQAYFDALAIQQEFEAERLKVIGDVRTLWYRLYVVGKQIETNRANQELLKPLIEVANARVATGEASQGDVLLGTLELSKLAEQLLTFEQQLVSAKADLNRTIGRDAEHPVAVPDKLETSLPGWTHAMLRQMAWEQQPQIAAAHIRTEATRWGIEVARLKRRPDISLGATWFAIDDNRPVPNIVDVGRDAWSIGVQTSVPLWHRKYNAMAQEAESKHAASYASVEDVMVRYDALLRDLWERAKTAAETAELYKETLLPQARQTLEADQKSYSNGTVEFDRVTRDFRNVLMLELGYHRAMGELAAMLARIKQAVGTDLGTP